MGTTKLLEDTLQQEVIQESNIKSISKELFAKTDLEVKTELTHNEINQITKLLFLQEKLLISDVRTLIQSFLSLRISKKRQSRKEFIESLQTEQRNAQQLSVFDKLKAKLGGEP